MPSPVASPAPGNSKVRNSGSNKVSIVHIRLRGFSLREFGLETGSRSLFLAFFLRKNSACSFQSQVEPQLTLPLKISPTDNQATYHDKLGVASTCLNRWMHFGDPVFSNCHTSTYALHDKFGYSSFWAFYLTLPSPRPKFKFTCGIQPRICPLEPLPVCPLFP